MAVFKNCRHREKGLYLNTQIRDQCTRLEKNKTVNMTNFYFLFSYIKSTIREAGCLLPRHPAIPSKRSSTYSLLFIVTVPNTNSNHMKGHDSYVHLIALSKSGMFPFHAELLLCTVARTSCP